MVPVSALSKHFCALCARAGKSLDDLAPKVGVLHKELFQMLTGRVTPTKGVIVGLARELDSDVRYIEKVASQIRPKLYLSALSNVEESGS